MVEVTQEDRDLLKSVMGFEGDRLLCHRIDAGLAYTAEVEEIAQHRITAQAEIAELRRQLNEARGLLRECFDAFSTLPHDALGTASDDAGSWPIRDEIMCRIDALASQPAPLPEREGMDELIADDADQWPDEVMTAQVVEPDNAMVEAGLKVYADLEGLDLSVVSDPCREQWERDVRRILQAALNEGTRHEQG